MRTIAAFALLTPLLLPAQPPQARAVMKQMGHGEGTLKPGDSAPDFELRKVKSADKVRLSAFRGHKPVALIFGSYT
jgi:hypothetical protein